MENVRIKNIPINDRPRERLISYGAQNLSNDELLSIILGSGIKDTSVKNISSIILSRAGSVSKIKNLSYFDLININGVGKAKACIILSLIELSNRINCKIVSFDKVKLNNPIKVFEFYKDKVNKYQEQFYCIFLDAKKYVIEEKMLFMGTVNHSLIHPRDIFKEAYKVNSSFIICVHNHPSNDVTPSMDDINVTKRIKDIGNLMGIKLIDHIIISDREYYSFLENGKI